MVRDAPHIEIQILDDGTCAGICSSVNARSSAGARRSGTRPRRLPERRGTPAGLFSVGPAGRGGELPRRQDSRMPV